MVWNIIIQAQQSDENAMLELIDKFKPLLKCYARKLNYEDAYEDMVLFFIELIKSLKIEKLDNKDDAVIVAYINVSVKNFYCKKVAVMIKQKNEVITSYFLEEYAYYVDYKLSKSDEYIFLLEMDLKKILTEDEYKIIYKIFVMGLPSSEIAQFTNKSRQAINQMKKRALYKIEKHMST